MSESEICYGPKCGRSHRPLGFGVPPETIAAEKLQEEHYQSAMAMSEKHRKLWVEASRESARLRALLIQISEVCDDNAAASCNQAMALAFVRSIAIAHDE